MSGGGTIYEYQRELTARLEQVTRERDEARAEVERLRTAPRTFVVEAAYDQARAEVEDLKSRLAALQETNLATMRTIAEAQREADTRNVCGDTCRRAVRRTPLVTEGKP